MLVALVTRRGWAEQRGTVERVGFKVLFTYEARLEGKDVLLKWNEAMSHLLEETETPPFEEVFHFD